MHVSNGRKPSLLISKIPAHRILSLENLNDRFSKACAALQASHNSNDSVPDQSKSTNSVFKFAGLGFA
jgi:hypothetical protein